MAIRLKVAAMLAVLLACVAAVQAQTVPAFAGPFTYPLPPGSFVMTPVVADLDGDGRADVLELGLSIQAVTYRLSNQNGSFGPRFASPWTGYSALYAVNDLGDGTPEFFTSVSPPYGPAALAGFVNGGRVCGSGAPLALASFNAPLPVPAGTQLHSMTIDGTQIIASIVLPATTQASIQAFQLVPPAVPGSSPTIVAVGAAFPIALMSGGASGATLRSCDLDGDGVMDAIVRIASLFQPLVYGLLRATPSGFVPNTPFPSFTLPFGNYIVAAHDLTGDGRAEILSQAPAGLVVYWNQGPVPGGDGGVAFVPVTFPMLSLGPKAFGDVDGDGDVDVIGASSGGIIFLLNDGAGSLTPTPLMPDPGNGSVSAGDLDGDGDLDLVVGGLSIRTYLNQTVPSVPVRPGTADVMALGTAVTPSGVTPTSYTGAPFFDFKETTAGQDVSLYLSAPQLAASQAWLLVESLAATGCPLPAFPVRKAYASFGAGTAAFGPFPLSASGDLALTFAAPPFTTPQNQSAIAQFLILDPGASNGVYATSEAHEIQF